MAGNQKIYILGTDGNLWLAEGPFGQTIPPKRTPVDITVNTEFGPSLFAFNSNELLVKGSDNNLWLERGPFGGFPWVQTGLFPPEPGTRFWIDGNVYSFYPWSLEGPYFITGTDQNLWFNPIIGYRTQIDGNAVFGQPITPNEVFVLGQDRALWHEFGPFGTVPLPPCNGGTTSCRTLVDTNVDYFEAINSNTVFTWDMNSEDLWLEYGPFGAPNGPPRVHVDGNVGPFQAVSAEEVFVLGGDRNLWLEHAPFGVVPLPTCSGLQGTGCRQLIQSNVSWFVYNWHAGGVFFIDTNNNLWQHGTPNVLIDENVGDFWPLSPEQTFPDVHTITPAAKAAPVIGFPRFFGPRRGVRRPKSSRPS